jgi:hypothetical protein
MVIRRVVERLRRTQRPIVRVVQRVLLHGSLFLLYFIGFSLSRLFMTVFARRTLYRRPPAGSSGWREAEGYELDELRLTRQS